MGCLGTDNDQGGQQYKIASALFRKGFPWLAPYGLGHVLHMVKLAVHPRRLLGHCCGKLVPYAQSVDKSKFEYARDRIRADHIPPDANVASWDDLCECVRKLLEG